MPIDELVLRLACRRGEEGWAGPKMEGLGKAERFAIRSCSSARRSVSRRRRSEREGGRAMGGRRGTAGTGDVGGRGDVGLDCEREEDRALE